MMRAWIALLFLSGCSHITLRPINPDHFARKAEVSYRLGVTEPTLNAMLVDTQAACDALDGKVRAWTAAGVTLGVLGGASGLSSIFTSSASRYATGGVSVGTAALTALATYMSTSYAQDYARKCTVNTGGQ